MLTRTAFASVLACLAAPVGAATTINLGTLGSASGSVSFPEAASYSDADLQTARFLFSVTQSGTLSVAFSYQQELQTPLVETCTDPGDPDSCTSEPSGAYEDYSGVDLRSFTLGPIGSLGSTTPLPGGFTDFVTGNPGAGIPTNGYAYVSYSFDLGRDFPLASGGAYLADLSGFGIIRGPSFPGSGGGPVNYTFSFSPAAVPEAGTWLMMMLGFGILGSALRKGAAPAPA